MREDIYNEQRFIFFYNSGVWEDQDCSGCIQYYSISEGKTSAFAKERNLNQFTTRDNLRNKINPTRTNSLTRQQMYLA